MCAGAICGGCDGGLLRRMRMTCLVAVQEWPGQIQRTRLRRARSTRQPQGRTPPATPCPGLAAPRTPATSSKRY